MSHYTTLAVTFVCKMHLHARASRLVADTQTREQRVLIIPRALKIKICTHTYTKKRVMPHKKKQKRDIIRELAIYYIIIKLNTI